MNPRDFDGISAALAAHENRVFQESIERERADKNFVVLMFAHARPDCQCRSAGRYQEYVVRGVTYRLFAPACRYIGLNGIHKECLEALSTYLSIAIEREFYLHRFRQYIDPSDDGPANAALAELVPVHEDYHRTEYNYYVKREYLRAVLRSSKKCCVCKKRIRFDRTMTQHGFALPVFRYEEDGYLKCGFINHDRYELTDDVLTLRNVRVQVCGKSCSDHINDLNSETLRVHQQRVEEFKPIAKELKSCQMKLRALRKWARTNDPEALRSLVQESPLPTSSPT